MSKFIIYVLHHETSGHVYVGKSSKGLYRPKQHGAPSNLSKYAHYPVVRWIKKLNAAENRYEIAVLEEHASAATLNEAEMHYIAYFKSIGVPLLNCTDGGDGAPNLTQEVKDRMAAISRARLADPAVRAKISLANKGRKQSSEHRANWLKAVMAPECRARRSKLASERTATHETREKQSASAKTRPPVEESTRRKMSAAHTGRVKSLEHRANMSKAQCNMSVETRSKMSASARSRSPEHRAKIGAALRGRKLSPEDLDRYRASRKPATDVSRAKMSRSARLRGKPRMRINLLRAA